MKIRKVVGTTIASAGLVVGLSGFAGASSAVIDNSGDGTTNGILLTNSKNTRLTNDNNAGVLNLNAQAASSGEADVTGNESAGSASTGDAANTSATSSSISVSNVSSGSAALTSGGSWGSDSVMIDNSGNGANNAVTVSNTQNTTVDNNNNVGVVNFNLQYATSGDATVTGNGSLGSATTGNVSNTSTTSTTISVGN